MLSAAENVAPTLFSVLSIASYNPRNENEVKLEKGKTYQVVMTEPRGKWYQTIQNDRRGWFPSSYVKKIDNDDPREDTANSDQIKCNDSSNHSSPKLSELLKSPLLLEETVHSDPVPVPIKPPRVESQRTPAFLRVQVIEARGLEVSGDVMAVIFRRDVMDDGKGVKIFNTQIIRKTPNPVWRETFQINIKDAESELLCVRFAEGKRFARKSNYFGEVIIPLRSSVRNFDSPHYILKWYNILDSKRNRDGTIKTVGQVRLYLEYFDTRETSVPTNFKRLFGWNMKEGGFNVRDIPRDWREKFEELGIKPSHLKRNNRFSACIFDIMKETLECDPETTKITQNDQIDTNFKKISITNKKQSKVSIDDALRKAMSINCENETEDSGEDSWYDLDESEKQSSDTSESSSSPSSEESNQPSTSEEKSQKSY